MPLNPQTEALLAAMAQSGFPDPLAQPVATTRALLAAMRPDLAPARAPLAGVEDRAIPGPAQPVPVRIYRPRGAGRRPLPLLVYFHGGGWVLGDLDGYDGLCCELTRQAECITVSVAYRLAPEHRYPAAVEDCDAALAWCAANAAALGADPARIVIAGDSAGGNLAAACALRRRARPGAMPAFMALIYPATRLAAPEMPSRIAHADGYFLTRAVIDWFAAHYIPDPARRAEVDASPLLAPELDGLPPTLVITAEYDPLVDEGEAFVARLRAAGVPVRLQRYAGTIHGFFGFYPLLDQGREAIAVVAGAIRGLPAA
jgi:acetyl esterase